STRGVDDCAAERAARPECAEPPFRSAFTVCVVHAGPTSCSLKCVDRTYRLFSMTCARLSRLANEAVRRSSSANSNPNRSSTSAISSTITTESRFMPSSSIGAFSSIASMSRFKSRSLASIDLSVATIVAELWFIGLGRLQGRRGRMHRRWAYGRCSFRCVRELRERTAVDLAARELRQRRHEAHDVRHRKRRRLLGIPRAQLRFGPPRIAPKHAKRDQRAAAQGLALGGNDGDFFDAVEL